MKRNTRTYDPMTRKLSKWLYSYIDRYVYGVVDRTTGQPRFAYSAERIASMSKYGGWVRKITMTDIENHLFAGSEYRRYYTTRGKSSVALLCIDIDAHEGQQNAWHVAVWIVENYFPNAYWEPSSGGLGVHLYILVAVQRSNYPMKRKLFNLHIIDFAKHLKELIADEFGPDSAIADNVLGTVTHRENGVIVPGKLVKIPKPETMKDVEGLTSMPVYELGDLAEVVYEAQGRAVDEFFDEGTDQNVWKEILAGRSKRRKRVRQPMDRESLREQLYDENPNTRVFRAVCYLLRTLADVPTPDEVHTFYCEMELNTEEDIGNRRMRRIQDALSKCIASYDPRKAGRRYDCSGFKEDRYLNLFLLRKEFLEKMRVVKNLFPLSLV